MLEHRLGVVFRQGLAFTLALAFASVLGCARAQTADPATSPQSRPTEGLTVQTSTGPVRFTVQYAGDDATREKGLMFVRSMPENQGMIFDFGGPLGVDFWMKNTYIPLDMLFVAADGHILNIAHQAKPFDETPITSGGIIRAVIEIDGGVADKLGIHTGDLVTDTKVFPAR